MDTVEQNGKTYVLGDPRAYVVIMKTEGFTLSMSMLSKIKFRIDFDEDRNIEDEVVMTEEVSKAYNALKQFMKPSSRRGYGTTREYDAKQADTAIEILETAKDVLTPVIPFEEILAPVKTLKNFHNTLDEMVTESLPADVAEKKKEIEAKDQEIAELKDKLMAMMEDRQKIASEVAGHVNDAYKEALNKLKDDGMEESLMMVRAPFNATTSAQVYTGMQENEVPGILVGPQAQPSGHDFDEDGDDSDDD